MRSSSASLPSRGAWIEMISSHSGRMERSVAPLTGSVDRNPSTYGGLYDESEGRSPHGERG